MFIKKFLNLPFFVLVLFLLTLLFGDSMSLQLKSQFYAISLFFKELIVFLLPFIIFSFVLTGLLSLKDESLNVVLVLVPLVCLSNFSGFWVSYLFTMPILKSGIITISELAPHIELEPAWSFPLPAIIRNDMALIFGVLFGLIGNFLSSNMGKRLFENISRNCELFKGNFIERISVHLYKIANFILKRIICSILPLFVMGFIIKMQYEGTLSTIIKEYAQLLFFVVFLAYGYMFLVMLFLSNQDFKQTLLKLKNLLPGVLIGLISMSSAAAIPTTIQGCEKNLQNKGLAKFVVPATANMHLLGDCFAIPIIGLALMFSFGYGLPSFGQYFVFSLYGVLAKFAAAGIPGGSALIFAPIFEKVFGFSAPMVTAVTAIYVLFDPIATSSNVFGHGMFATLFEKVYNKLLKK